jgi:urease accessory protein
MSGNLELRPNRRLVAAVAGGAALSVCFVALPAGAHTGQPAHGLSSGLVHPLLGVDHLLAMVTVGVLAVILGRPLAVPAAFLATMVAGGVIGMAGLASPGGEVAVALTVVALGAALIAGRAVRPELAIGLVALAGLVHGHAHGAEVPAAAHPAVYVAGFVLATAALHFTGVAAGFGIRGWPTMRAAFGALVVGLGIGLTAGLI